jgi:hypothetical protein
MNFILFLTIVTASISIHSCQLNQECRPELDVDFRNVRDISFQRANDFQDCCLLCSNDQNPTVANRCQIWTFVLETKVCWFKVGTPTRLSSAGRVSGIRSTSPVTVAPTLPTRPPVGTGCSVESGFVYNNNFIAQPVPNVANFADCCSLCQRTVGCVAWSFLNDYRFCYLRNAANTLANRMPYVNSFSGSLVIPLPTTPLPAASCTSERDFVYRDNDISQPITLAVGATQLDCCALCRNTATCVAWSYLVAQRLCYLKRAVHTLSNQIAFAGSFSGIVQTSTITTARPSAVCAINQNFIYPGGDLVGANMNSVTDCCNFCGQTAGCVAWDYLSDCRYCFLKNRLPTPERRVVYQGAFSGVLTR